MLFTNFSQIYHSAPNIMSTINVIEKLHENNSPSWKNKLDIALGMLDLYYALENDKPVTPAARVANFDELTTTRVSL
jgi:hypothetical protein